jgi:hypothetical protein
LEIKEIDILPGGEDHDLLSPERQDAILHDISEGKWEIVVAAPSCSTFSRSTFTKDGGPTPVRDMQWPDGFPWLSKAKQRKADEGSILARFAVTSALLVPPVFVVCSLLFIGLEKPFMRRDWPHRLVHWARTLIRRWPVKAP